MQRQRRPYWTGKAPDWAATDADEAPPAADAADAAVQPHPAQGSTVDPRLLRLTQRQGSLAARRSAREAAVVRRRSRSPEAVAAAEGQPAFKAASRQFDLGGADQGMGEECCDEDEEAIAARRLAIRARQLATEAVEAAGPGADEGSEDSSEYTTDDDSESDHGHVLLKPAFVPKVERETLAEREAALVEAEQTTRQPAEQLEERRRQTQELVAQAQQQDVQQAFSMDAPDLNTDDESNEVEEYEAWRARELHRIARDRHLRQEGAPKQAAWGPADVPSALPLPPPKKKWKFLQKYWHRGAFFQGEDEDGASVLGDTMHRDYNAPTGEDKFDKEMLPKIMQVRNFGRRGRTKWTHLLAEDTSAQAVEGLPGRPQGHQQAQDFSKPRNLKT